MKRSNILNHLVSGFLAAFTLVSQAQTSAELYVLEAQKLAGEDLRFLLPICNPQPAVRAAPSPEMDAKLAQLINQPPPKPGQAFDDLYYVGSAWVSAWILKTTDGLVLIDALNNQKEAAEVIIAGMQQLGLDPKQIRFVLVTHGHGDHYGGAQMIAERYGARVIASEIDWQMMASTLEFDSKLWDRPPKRDIAVHEGETLKIGATTIRFLITPGHTLGTISPVFEVHDGGRPHTAMIWGGTSFNFGRDMVRLESYIAQTERIREISAKWHIDVALSNHPGYDGTVAKLRKREIANPGSVSPFVIGQPAVDRAMRVLNSCAKAQKERFLQMALSNAKPGEESASLGHDPSHESLDDHLMDELIAYMQPAQ